MNGPVDKARPHKQGVDDAFITDHFHDCESANEQIRPERNSYEKQPKSTGALGAGRDEKSGGEPKNKRQQGGGERQLHRAPEDCQMRIGEGDRVVENILGEQHAIPAVGGKIPNNAAIWPLGQERIDDHDEERSTGGKGDNDQSRSGQQPATANILARGSGRCFNGGVGIRG